MALNTRHERGGGPPLNFYDAWVNLQGNTATVTTPAGQVSCTARYDPFGVPTRANPAPNGNGVCASIPAAPTVASPNDQWYRGGRRDQTSGQYQYGARTYDPTKNTWLTPDTYRTGSGAQNLSVGTDPLTSNTYTYVNGDPVNLTDPSGHDPCPRDGCRARDREFRAERIARERRREFVETMAADFEQNWEQGLPDYWEDLSFDEQLNLWMSSRVNSLGLDVDADRWNAGSIAERAQMFEALGEAALAGPGCDKWGPWLIGSLSHNICSNPEAWGRVVQGLQIVAVGALTAASLGLGSGAAAGLAVPLGARVAAGCIGGGGVAMIASDGDAGSTAAGCVIGAAGSASGALGAAAFPTAAVAGPFSACAGAGLTAAMITGSPSSAGLACGGSGFSAAMGPGFSMIPTAGRCAARAAATGLSSLKAALAGCARGIGQGGG